MHVTSIMWFTRITVRIPGRHGRHAYRCGERRDKFAGEVPIAKLYTGKRHALSHS